MKLDEFVNLSWLTLGNYWSNKFLTVKETKWLEPLKINKKGKLPLPVRSGKKKTLVQRGNQREI